jgi:hypothetical protein
MFVRPNVHDGRLAIVQARLRAKTSFIYHTFIIIGPAM